MRITDALKQEMKNKPQGTYFPQYFRAIGYRTGKRTSPPGRRADGIESLFLSPDPYVYQNDLIVGSVRPLFCSLTEEETKDALQVVAEFPERAFHTNKDHYAPDYETILSIGIGGLLERIESSKKVHAQETDAVAFLESMHVCLCALRERLLAHAACADALVGKEGYDAGRLKAIAENCRVVAIDPPQSFAQALQLVWMIHTCFLYEGRYAMALGRLDQYLYPFFQKDVESGLLSHDEATLLLENVFLKICEPRFYRNSDDVVNICIGGVDAEGKCAINALTYCILYAVRNVNMPGPNLSARVPADVPDHFLDECLKVIGTGLGYPALMNDSVNMTALRRYGYEEEDIRNYSMVGCIENFITGMQPPWSDGRFDTPRYLEYVLLGGVGYDKGRKGLRSVPLDEITSMEQFMLELDEQLVCGVKQYVDGFNQSNTLADPWQHTSPFLSCFCKDCIGRARDINMGGSKYPSVHGAALMGVGTMSDSLAAIERVVFENGESTLAEIADAMRCNFEGYEALREKLLKAPKYGNNDPFVDKYAIWFTKRLSELFMQYKTRDGGGFYSALAANTSNIHAGRSIGATPDGRLAGTPLSDAASPTYGRDTKGPTAAILSLSKPDYTYCACGSVINQKYSPSMFEGERREKLMQLIKVYFARGGQEIQINATSTEVLRDAMEHPENYASLTVRVSGFSALYTTLDRAVQEDILSRTQQG